MPDKPEDHAKPVSKALSEHDASWKTFIVYVGWIITLGAALIGLMVYSNYRVNEVSTELEEVSTELKRVRSDLNLALETDFNLASRRIDDLSGTLSVLDSLNLFFRGTATDEINKLWGLLPAIRRLEETVLSKADSATVQRIRRDLDAKANRSIVQGLETDVQQLETDVDSKADRGRVQELETALDAKANQSTVQGLETDVQRLKTDVDSKADWDTVQGLRSVLNGKIDKATIQRLANALAGDESAVRQLQAQGIVIDLKKVRQSLSRINIINPNNLIPRDSTGN